MDRSYPRHFPGKGIADFLEVTSLLHNLKCSAKVHIINPSDLEQFEIVQCLKVVHSHGLPDHQGLVDRIRNPVYIRQIQFNGLVTVISCMSVVFCNHPPDIYLVRIPEQLQKKETSLPFSNRQNGAVVVFHRANNDIRPSGLKTVQDPFGLDDLYSQSGMVL